MSSATCSPAAIVSPDLHDRRWLRRRYVTDQAPVTTIAAEAGVDPVNVWRALARHGIALRGRVDVTDWSEVLTRRYLTRAVEAGMSAYAIARDTGADRTTVGEHLARHGLVPEPDDADELRALYVEEGLSLVDVAEVLGVHPRTVRRRLVRAQVPLRPRGRRPAAT